MNFCCDSDSGLKSAALTLLIKVKPKTIAWEMRLFLDVVDREPLECTDMSALLKRSRPRGIAALQSTGSASALQHARTPEKIGVDFTKSFF